MTSLDGIDETMLSGFFDGWPNPPTPAVHLRILRRSSQVVLALPEDERRVVGFINAVSDGFFSAAIPLLEVIPLHRRRGIGTELVRRMRDQLAEFYSVDLACDPEMSTFYHRLGFESGVAMMLRNFRHNQRLQSTGDARE